MSRICEHFGRLRVAGPSDSGNVDRKAPFFVDDVTVALRHEVSRQSPLVADVWALTECRALCLLGLSPDGKQSSNIALSPDNFAGDLFRIPLGTTEDCLNCNSNRALLVFQIMRDVPNHAAGFWSSAGSGGIFRRLPFRAAESLIFHGVTFDCVPGFAKQLGRVLEKPEIRLAVRARVAVSTWGLETPTLRLSHDALFATLVRYGVVLLGSALAEIRPSSCEKDIAEIAARRFTGRASKLGYRSHTWRPGPFRLAICSRLTVLSAPTEHCAPSTARLGAYCQPGLWANGVQGTEGSLDTSSQGIEAFPDASGALVFLNMT